jgi:hypothetical protein
VPLWVTARRSGGGLSQRRTDEAVPLWVTVRRSGGVEGERRIDEGAGWGAAVGLSAAGIAVVNKRKSGVGYSAISALLDIFVGGGAALARNMNACSVATYATEHAFMF